MTDQRIAIVTGGASGLGFAIAKKMAEHQVSTVLIGRNQEKLKEACCQLGPASSYRIQDLSQLDGIPAMVESIVKEKGTIDILVNNAGINLKKDMLEVTDDEFQLMLQTNLTSVFAMSREVARVMKKQRSGAIINISSMAAYYGIPKVIAYTAAKAGVEGMTRAMAVELSPFGITVNCIAPGFINTKMSFNALNNDVERKQRVLSRTPMGKLGEPADVAAAAYFLTSPEAAFITGASLPVDGGNSIGF